MKTPASGRNTIRLVLAGSVAAVVTATSARAANQTWTGGGADAKWSNVLNWNGAVPGSTSLLNSPDVALFNSATANTWGATAANPVAIDSATQNIGGLSFGSAAGNFFLGSTAGNALRLSSGGAIEILDTLTAPAAVETINAPLQIQGAGGTYTFANHSANGGGPNSGTLNFGGAISGGAAGATVLTLGGSNTNANTISGVISNGSTTTLALNKTGAGTWNLTRTNSFTGGTMLSGGTLAFSTGALGSTGTIDFTGNATLRWNSGNTQDTSRLKIEDGVTATLDVGTNSVTVFSALQLGPLKTSSLAFQGASGGYIQVQAANSYTGATTVNAVTLDFRTSGSIKESTTITFNPGAAVVMLNQNSGDAAVDRLGDAASITSIGGQINYGNFSSAGLIYAETMGVLNTSGGATSVFLSSNMTGGGGNLQTLTLSGLNRTGAGTVSLIANTTGPNTTTNVIKVAGVTQTPAGQIIGPWATTGTNNVTFTDYAVYDAAGRIVPANLAATTEDLWTSSSNVNLASAATLTATRTINSLRYTGGTTSTLTLGSNNLETFGILHGTNSDFTISGPGAVRQPGTAAANLYLTAGVGSITISAPIQDNTGALTVVKAGGGQLTLNGTNTYSGGKVLQEGSLSIGSPTALGTGPVTIYGGSIGGANVINANNNPLIINGDFSTLFLPGSPSFNFGAGTVSLGTTAGTNRTISVGGGASIFTLGGAMSDGTTANSLVKAGSGTLALRGSNTYTGSTTVTSGTLLLAQANAYAGGTVVTNGGVMAQNGNALGTGSVTLSAATNLSYAASADVPLNIGGALEVTAGGPTATTLGGSVGGTPTSARIAVAGVATISDAAHTVNIHGVPGTTPATGAYTLIQGGAGSSLNPTTAPVLGRVFNNTAFTVNPSGTFTRTATELQVNITSATPLATAFWKGGLTGATRVWAASNGTTQNNWVATAGGTSQPLVPGPGVDLIFSASPVTTGATTSTLGADMTIGTLTQQDTTNQLTLNDDGSTLTITPANPATGITVASGASIQGLNASIVLGADQTWTNNGNSFVVNGAMTMADKSLTTAGASSLTLNGPIAGSGGVRHTGPGLLTLAGANGFTGSLNVDRGTLLVSSINAPGTVGPLGKGTAPVTLGSLLGSATFSYNGPTAAMDRPLTLNIGTQTIDASTSDTTTLTLNGVIDGVGALTKSSGASTLALTGSTSNSYSGLTTANGGVLLLAKSGSASAIANGGLTIAPGAIVRYAGISTDMMGTGPVTISAPGQLDFNGKTDMIGSVSIIAGGTDATPLANTAVGGSLSIGTLGITASPGTVTTVDLNGGTLAVGGTVTFNASPTGRALITGGALALGGDRTFDVGTAGAQGSSLEVASSISGSLITKTGFGPLLLSGANTFTGGAAINAGIVTARHAGALNPTTGGAVSVASGATLSYFAAADAPLGLASTLSLAANTTLGTSLGSALNSARIDVAGAATVAAGPVGLNIFSLSGTQTPGVYTLLHGGVGSTLNAGAFSIAQVFNNTDFTVGNPAVTPTDVSLPIIAATPLAIAYWKGGVSSSGVIWAAGNGSNSSNWTTTPGGAVQGLIPGAGADVIFSAKSPDSGNNPTNLGTNMSIRSLALTDPANSFSLVSDGHTLTLGTGGLTTAAGLPASTIAARVSLGAAQSWTLHSASALTVSGAIVGAGDLTKAGPGTLLLNGANSFTGVLAVNGGVVSVAADNGLGNVGNGVTLGAGGALRTTAGFTLAATRVLTATGTVLNPSVIDLNFNAATFTLAGADQLAGSGVLAIAGTGTAATGTLAIEGANAGFTGGIQIGAPGRLIGQTLAPRVFTAANATTLLLRNGGTLSAATRITVNNNAALIISQPPAALTGRLGTTTPLTFHNGRFQYDPNGTAAISETFGNVGIDGMLVLTGGSTTGPADGTTLNFGTLTRTDHATLALRSRNVAGVGSIGGPVGVGVRYLFSGMVDSGGTAGTTSRGVVPWAANTGSTSSSFFNNLVTYDADGFRILASTEKTSVNSPAQWNMAVLTTQNVEVTGAIITVSGTPTVLSLAFGGDGTLIGTGTLNNSSGAVLSTNPWSLNGPTLNLPNGGYFHLSAPAQVVGTAAITGTGGVTTSALNANTQSQLRFTNTVANTFTGGLFINGMSQVTFRANNQLGRDGGGLDTGNVTLGGGQLLFSPASAVTVSLSDAGGTARPISVNASQGTIGTAVPGAVLQIPGVISGSGQIQFGGGTVASASGVVELTNPGANTFTGGTLVSSGILRISRGDHLGTGPILLNGGTLQAGASFTLPTAPTLLTTTTIDTQSFDLTLGGGINGVGNPGFGLTKTGSGVLTLAGQSDFPGMITVSAGSLLVSGSASGSSSTVASGATLGGTGIIGPAAVATGAFLQGGDGTTASGALTSGGNVTLADGSTIKLTLGSSATHSSLTRTAGTWAFDSDQAFSFTLLGATPATYDNVISGLTGSESGIGTIAAWQIITPGVTGTFSYDNAGGVDLVVATVPEAKTTTLLGGTLGLLGFVRRRRPG